MATLKFQLEDGTTVFVEATEVHKNSPGLIPATRSAEDDVEKAAISFESQIGSLSKMAAAMMKSLRDGQGEQPSEIDISFGLKAATDINGFIVSRTGPDASFSISLHWRDHEKEKKAE